ncbi:hypothetical protein TNCV_694961 [Trichonephila clavipes]|nr:hypothetical protein TNCV_694961 [Trichonephila clavipes]
MENTLEGGMGPPTSREDLKLDEYLGCLHGIIHLQTSMPSPGFEPRPHDTVVSVTKSSSISSRWLFVALHV